MGPLGTSGCHWIVAAGLFAGFRLAQMQGVILFNIHQVALTLFASRLCEWQRVLRLKEGFSNPRCYLFIHQRMIEEGAQGSG